MALDFENRILEASNDGKGSDLGGGEVNDGVKNILEVDEKKVFGKEIEFEKLSIDQQNNIKKILEEKNYRLGDIYKIDNTIFFIGTDGREYQKLFELDSVYRNSESDIYMIIEIYKKEGKIYYDAVAKFKDGGHEMRTYGYLFEDIEFGTGFSYNYNDLPRWNTRGTSGPDRIDAKEYMLNKRRKGKGTRRYR